MVSWSQCPCRISRVDVWTLQKRRKEYYGQRQQQKWGDNDSEMKVWERNIYVHMQVLEHLSGVLLLLNKVLKMIMLKLRPKECMNICQMDKRERAQWQQIQRYGNFHSFILPKRDYWACTLFKAQCQVEGYRREQVRPQSYICFM